MLVPKTKGAPKSSGGQRCTKGGLLIFMAIGAQEAQSNRVAPIFCITTYRSLLLSVLFTVQRALPS